MQIIYLRNSKLVLVFVLFTTKDCTLKSIQIQRDQLVIYSGSYFCLNIVASSCTICFTKISISVHTLFLTEFFLFQFLPLQVSIRLPMLTVKGLKVTYFQKKSDIHFNLKTTIEINSLATDKPLNVQEAPGRTL